MERIVQQSKDSNDTIIGSDRSFGIVFSIVSLIVCAFGFAYAASVQFILGSLSIAGLFLLTALIKPKILHPLNIIWFRFGLLLHRFLSPVILAITFFGGVLPTGLIMRALGHDLLSLKKDPDRPSYWVVRDEPVFKPETMRNQF